MTWLTVDDPRLLTLWPGALDFDEAARGIYLDSARTQCEEYLGAARVTAAGSIPSTWVLAQAMQARALSMSAAVNQAGELGGFGETLAIFPMDWKVTNLLRPRQPLGTA